MKCWMYVALAVWAAIAVREAAAAITIQDGVPWVYSVSGDGATILHGPGRGDLTIPPEVDGYPVLEVSTNAFEWCSGLESVVIGDGVTRIGNSAFWWCGGLTNVTIGNGVKYIDSYAFGYCSNLTKMTMSDSVTHIGKYAFSSCNALTSVTIPPSVASIGNGAFWGCSSLKTVYAPASWEGTTMLQGDRVPEGCTVIYGTPPEPSAEARYGAWLESIGKTSVELPMGGDADADGMSNWEECVAGTDPLDAEDRFEARIRRVDGKIVVDSVVANTGRVYRVHGTTSLVGDEGGEPVWDDVTDEEDLSRTDWRYFKLEARFSD